MLRIVKSAKAVSYDGLVVNPTRLNLISFDELMNNRDKYEADEKVTVTAKLKVR